MSIACGLYLFGVFRLPHDDRVEHIGALRMIFASIFIGLALYMFPLLLGGKPAGVVSEALVAFLPPQLKEAGPNTGGKSSELAWYPDYMEAWTQAVNEGKLIFIDFTGVTCTNCRYNEQNVFPKSEVVSQLKNYVRVRLFVDSVPNPKLTWTEAREQAARNETWRNTVARSPANPTYLIFQPDPKEPFTKDGVIKGVAVSTTDGAIYDIAEFVDFLKKPLDAKAASQAKSTSSSWHRDYKKAWEEATKENRLIFVNFTGIMNTNCRYNEVNVLNKQEVTARLQAYARLQLFCDRLPDEKLPPDQSQKQVKWNEEWRGEMAQGWYPTYIVFKPDPQKTLTADGWPKGEVLETCGGQIADVPGFVALFDNPGKGKKAIGTASSH